MENETSFATSFTLGTDAYYGDISDAGKTLITGFADNIQVTDLTSQKTVSVIKINGNINDLKLASNGIIFAVTNQDTLCVCDGSNQKEISLKEEGTAVTAFEGTAFVGTKRGNFLVIELSSGTVKKIIPISSSKITKLVIGYSKKIVVIGSSNGLISIFSIGDSLLLNNDLKYHNMPITSISLYDDDSRCLTAAHERDVHLWDIDKLKHLEKLESNTDLTRYS